MYKTIFTIVLSLFILKAFSQDAEIKPARKKVTKEHNTKIKKNETRTDSMKDNKMNDEKTTEKTTSYPGEKTTNKVVKSETGLEYIDIKEGTGAMPKKGEIVVVHYIGYFLDGKVFDKSDKNDKPLETPIGVQRVIKGWDEGIMSMKVGGKRKLIIPSNLAYGENGYPGVIPPNSNLVFDIELLSIK